MVIWSWAVGFLLIGYLCMTRSFAYLGVPPLFIGEIVLAAFLLLKPRVTLGTWVASLLRASPLSGLGLVLLVFMLYGTWQLGRGILGGKDLFYPLKIFIFNYYTIYLFLGIWVGLHSPDLLQKLMRILAWVHGIYAVLWLVVLKHFVDLTPGSGPPLFGVPLGGQVAILGLLCFERDLRPVVIPLVLNIAATLAMQQRAAWLGLGTGMLVWGLLTGRLGRIAAIGVSCVAALVLIELSGIQVKFGDHNSGLPVSRDILSVVIAPIDVELANELSPRGRAKEGTVEWRQKWWRQIWRAAQSGMMVQAFGHGYGFDLWGLAPDDVRAGQAEEIRTPHNVFYFALGYTGWVGVALFAMLQLAIIRLLWRSYRLAGQACGLVFWVMSMTMALVEQSIDTPYRAIPFYLLMGLSIAPGLQPKE